MAVALLMTSEKEEAMEVTEGGKEGEETMTEEGKKKLELDIGEGNIATAAAAALASAATKAKVKHKLITVHKHQKLTGNKIDRIQHLLKYPAK